MIGPAIPEGLTKKKPVNESEIMIALSDDEEDRIGPQIPTTHNIGPQIPSHLLAKNTPTEAGPHIPPHLLKQSNNTDEIAISDEEQDDIGPQIPQHLVEEKRSAGPEIPAHLLAQKCAVDSPSDIEPQIPEEEIDPDAFAPELPPDLIVQPKQTPQGRRRRPVGPSFPTGPIPPPEQDECIVGPALPKDYNPEEEAKYSAIRAIEERTKEAREAMEKKEEDSGKVSRPEWMLVPPEVDYLKKANSSKSRQFTNKTMSKEELDSAEWTMTPAQKQQRLEDLRSGKRQRTEEVVDFSQLDRERIRNVQEYNMQTRPLTLLELHQQKKKKSKEPNTTEDVTKRAFDREKDLLGGKKMDRKTKKEMLKQCSQLGDKFGYGSSSFL